MERPDDSSASRSQLEAQLYDLQHSMRNKLGILDGTFELMHPLESASDDQEKEDIARFKRNIESLHELIEEISNVIDMVNRN